MRSFLLLLFTISIASQSFAQTEFLDDFESYEVGDAITESSSNFVLWPAAAATDAFVSDDQAASGTKSIYLPGGVDLDILFNLGQQYTSGNLTYSMDVFIPQGRNFYFNFQGSDAVGADGNWVLQCYLRRNGIFEVDNSDAILFENAYEQDAWMNITLDVNLTENLWRMFVNDECLGSFVNREDGNQVYSVNLFPDDGNAEAYVDNVSFTHTDEAPEVNIDVDATYALVDLSNNIDVRANQFYGLEGTSQAPGVIIFNEGQSDITTLGLSLEVDGEVTTRDVDVNIAPGAGAAVDFGEIMFSNSTQRGLFSIQSVNGGKDDNTCNDLGPVFFNGVRPGEGKKVFVEESTGVQCPFCPRGTVIMDYMSEKYGDYFVGIAAHDNDQGPDPMTNDEWNLGMAPLTSNPSAWLDRDTATITTMVPYDILEQNFHAKLQRRAFSILENTATWDEATRKLEITVTTSFPRFPLTQGALLVGLTEDGVTSTDPAYGQTNAYANGALGPMAGFEDLPQLVPADLMIYDKVMRQLLTPPNGLPGAYANAGDVTEHKFSTTIPEEWNIANMKIVSAFVNEDLTVENSGGTSIAQFLSNTNEVPNELSEGITVAPNPMSDQAQISFDLEDAKPVMLSITTSNGKVIRQTSLGSRKGASTYTLDVSDLTSGMYYLNFRSENNVAIKRIVISK